MAAHAICFDFCYQPQPSRIKHSFAGPECQACHFKTIEGLYFFCFTQFITPKLHKGNNRGAMNQKSPWVIDQILHCVTILLWIFIAYILVWHPHQKEK